MDWIGGIQKAVDYMEEHITQELDYCEIAKQAYSSNFHFQRVFSILCRFTIGDYIRMRRLTLAGSELVETDTKILDIAVKYGYDTQESFSRAFTRFHGATPSQARKGASLKSFSRLSVKLILDGANMVDYRIEVKGPLKIICRKMDVSGKKEMTVAGIADFWRQCREDNTILALDKYISKKDAFGGCIVGVSFGTDAVYMNFPYGIGAHYNGAPVIEKGFAIEEIPAHTYVIFRCEGTMPDAFDKLYRQICSEFFPASEYQPSGGTDFEVYPSADVANPNYTCEIWVAVEKK